MGKEVAQDTAEPSQRYAPAQTIATVELVAIDADAQVEIVIVVNAYLLANGLMPTLKDMVQTTTATVNRSMKHQERSAEGRDHQLSAMTLATIKNTHVREKDVNSLRDLVLLRKKRLNQLKTQMKLHSPE